MALMPREFGSSRWAFVLLLVAASAGVFAAVLWSSLSRTNSAIRSTAPAAVATRPEVADRPVASIGIGPVAPAVGGAHPGGQYIEHDATSREDLSSILRAEPYFERGTLVGLRILPGSRASLIAKLGLQSGDVVRTLDGLPVHSADAAWQAIDDAISLRTSITLGVEREGVVMPMTLDGARLSQPPLP